jgi:hypothetical protein
MNIIFSVVQEDMCCQITSSFCPSLARENLKRETVLSVPLLGSMSVRGRS